MIGLPVEEAAVRIGLEVQFFCSADPAGWDPIHGKSPVHFAGNVHAKALEKAIRAHLEPKNGDKRSKPQRTEDRDQKN